MNEAEIRVAKYLTEAIENDDPTGFWDLYTNSGGLRAKPLHDMLTNWIRHGYVEQKTRESAHGPYAYFQLTPEGYEVLGNSIE